MQTMSGGCQCGRVRYNAEVEPEKAILCHCNMCKKASGGVSTPFINVAAERIAWQHQPDWYQSSPIAHRAFCRDCGTPLGFAFLDGEDMDLTIGSFDDPAPFRPTLNYASESLLEAWAATSHLPRQRSDENENLMRRWREAGVEPPA